MVYVTRVLDFASTDLGSNETMGASLRLALLLGTCLILFSVFLERAHAGVMIRKYLVPMPFTSF